MGKDDLKKRSLEIAQFCANAIDEKFGGSILILDVSELSGIADYFVIATANSSPQLNAIVDNVYDKVRKGLDIRPRRTDGDPESGWISMDYSDVLVHLMTEETRCKYALEKLWGDAPVIDMIPVTVGE